MYILSAINGENPYNSDRISNEHICINSCGHYIINNKTYGTTRENGRSDFQLIYIWKGRGAFKLNGINTNVDEGSIVLYKPFQPQVYTYSGTENSEIYWIHFTGRGIEELLEASNLCDKQIYFVGKFSIINDLILKIVKEIQIKPYKYELFCSAYFNELISHILRQLMQLKNAEINKKYEKIAAAMESMHSNYNYSESVDDYSRKCNLSKYHFIHLFKQYTGIP